jgi:hypothetical protein
MIKTSKEETAAQAAREHANIRLRVLTVGIGKNIEHSNPYDLDELRTLIDIINTELLPAIKTAEEAHKAMIPFRLRGLRRPRKMRPRVPKKQAKKK